MLLWFTIALLLAAGRANEDEFCLPGVQVFDCTDSDLCDYIDCPNHPDAECHVSHCGGCFVEFFVDGIKLEPDQCEVPCDDGYWTEWFDRDDPGDFGDYETIADLHREYPEKLCHQPTAIDAVAVHLHKDYRSVGQIVTANVKKGFVCANKHNPGGCCDYKVRFCCPHVPYCKGNSWTKFYNGDDPEGEGDYEYLGDLRKDCPEEICAHPTAIYARSAHSKLSYKTVGQEVTINPKYGFSCFNKDQKHHEYCDDYEVSFCCPKEPEPYCPKGAWTEWFNRDKPSKTCDCETLDQLWKEHPEKICKHPKAIDVRVASTGDYYWKEGQNVIVSPHKGFRCINAENSRPCLDYKVRFCCPEEIDHFPPPKCVGHWTPFFDRDDSTGKGDFETLALFHSDNPENICDNPSAIDVRFARNGASYLSNLQNVVVNLKEGFYCENKGQKCEDYKVRFCCPDVCEKKCLDGYWTRFFDIDDPDDDSDHEAFDVIRHKYPTEVCGNPTDIDARLLNGDDYTTASQDVQVSLADGFLCENEAWRQECCDYKVRFCCPKIEPKCIKGEWTEYQNSSPNNNGDYESNPCLSGLANSIDVKLADGRRYTAANQVVHISLLGGFRCINDEQPDGELCQDYKARFCCNEEPTDDNYHTCTIAGDPHYYTLDGKRYDFQGDCLYDVLSTTGSPYETCLTEFSVWAQNEYRGNNRAGHYVTIVGKVIIRFSGQEIILFKDGTASVNGDSVTTFPYDGFYSYSLSFSSSDRGVTFAADFGLTVSYKYAHHLEVSVSESYFDEVEGLCGNFNGNPDDDFTLKGTSDVVPDVNEFALSFALDEPCVDPPELPECDEDLENEAEYFCATLLTNSCFDNCDIASIPSFDDILRDCVYDYCYGEEKTNALTMTAQSTNIQCESSWSIPCTTIEQAIDETFCDDNEEFQQAGCDATCDNKEPACEGRTPPGCRCIDGYVRNKSNICIPADSCDCTDPEGNVISHDSPLIGECNCTCDEGEFVECTDGTCTGTCIEEVCEENIPIIV